MCAEQQRVLPDFGKGFSDDTFLIQLIEHNENFLQHINNIDSAIQFTVEDTKLDGFMSFLDAMVTLEHNATLATRYTGNMQTPTSIYTGTAIIT